MCAFVLFFCVLCRGQSPHSRWAQSSATAASEANLQALVDDYLSKITAALSAGTVAPLPPSPNAVLVMPTSGAALQTPLVNVQAVLRVRYQIHTRTREMQAPTHAHTHTLRQTDPQAITHNTTTHA